MSLSRFPRKRVAIALLAPLLHTLVAPPLGFALDIPNGQAVELSFVNTITPENAVVGQTVMLTCTQDVIVGGEVVISQGAAAQGEIIEVQKKGSIGKPAKIHVTLRSVEAVDGTSVALTGQKSVAGEDKQTSSLVITLLCCVLGLLQKGGDAEIAAGSTVRGMVIGPVSIDVVG